jgi:hypothetical protein
VICGSLLNPDDYQKLNIVVDSSVITTLKHAYFADAETRMTKKFSVENCKFVDFLNITYPGYTGRPVGKEYKITVDSKEIPGVSFQIPFPIYTTEMKISPDDEFIAIETSDGLTKIYTIKEGKLVEFPSRIGIVDINSRYLLYQNGLYDHKLRKELKTPEYDPRLLIGYNLVLYASYEGSSHGAPKISHKLFNINNANMVDVNISIATSLNRVADGVIINLGDKAIIIKNNMEIRTIDLPKLYIDLGILG